MVSLSWVVSAGLVGLAAAHPGESHDVEHMKRELVARDYAAKSSARSLSLCARSDHALKLEQRSIQRRMNKVQDLRRERGVTAGEFR